MTNMFRAIVSTVVPAASLLNESEWRTVDTLIETAIRNRPRALARQLGLFLRLLKWVPVLRYGKPFTSLSPLHRKRAFEYLENHRIQLLRAAFWGLRTLAMLGYYCLPETTRSIGYHPTPKVGRPCMRTLTYDIVVIGSGAGGGTVAQELSPLCRRGLRIAVLEKGPKLRNEELGGDELKMCQALYEHGGAHLTSEKTMTLAYGSSYGGSTTVYTGTSLLPSDRVIQRWNVPDVALADISRRARKFMDQNNVHFLNDQELNDNNKLFVEGCKRANYKVEQFPLNVKGCRGSGLCNLGCPNQAKQGTGRVQLPAAERNGVEVVTRCEVLRMEERTLLTRVIPKEEGDLGEPSSWQPGEYRIEANIIVVCGGAVGSPALLLRSGLGSSLPRIGHGFTCHPALIMVAAHEKPITNFVGHPKSFYVDEFAETERFVLETCMYYPFVTAKSLTGFGAEHNAFLQAFPRLQMILVLACDEADERNRVTIDRQGKPVIHYRFTPEVERALVRGAIAGGKIFFAAGAQRIHLPVANPPAIESQDRERLDRDAANFSFVPGKVTVSAAHLQGGCAMGEGPEDSVTDSHGRVHGHPWLFVADASLFPNSLNINPYLTIMALADRVAETVYAGAA